MARLAETIGEAEIKIRADAAGFDEDTRSKVGGALKGVAKVGVAAFAAVGVAATGFAVKAIGEATELAKAMGQTEAVIKSTGGTAGVTTEQVKKLSDSLARVAGVEGEVIQEGANMLLTFTNVQNRVGAGNDIFNQSVAVLTDLATAMGTEPKQAAIQLGKALNDPIKGITALTRIGVTFSAEQKAVIESLVATGNVAGAQKVILAELNKEFGGSAKAAGDARSPIEKLQLVFKDVAESVGGVLIPILNDLLPTIQPLVESLGPLLGGVAKALIPIFAALTPAITQIAEAFGPVMTQVINSLTPVLGPLAQAFASIIVALLPLMPIIGELAALLGQLLANALIAIAPLLELLIGVVVEVFEAFKPFLPQIMEVARTLFAALMPALMGIFEAFRPLLPMFFEMVKQLLPPFLSLMQSLSPLIAALAPIITLLANVLKSGLMTQLLVMIPVMTGLLKVLEGIVWIVTKAVEWIGKLATSLNKIKLPGFLTPGSPSPLENTLSGIVANMKQLRSIGGVNLGGIGGLSPVGAGTGGGTIVVPLYIDGREVARATASPMRDELNRIGRNTSLFGGRA